MGDPKKPKNKYSTPRNPWTAEELSKELFLLGTYGLRNKRELWRVQTELSRIRKQARALLAATPEVREKLGTYLISRLYRLGLAREGASIDDILSLKVEDILERRLQTLIWRKGMARSAYEARQLITHRKVSVGNRTVTKPGYLVQREEEDSLSVGRAAQVEGAAK